MQYYFFFREDIELYFLFQKRSFSISFIFWTVSKNKTYLKSRVFLEKMWYLYLGPTGSKHMKP